MESTFRLLLKSPNQLFLNTIQQQSHHQKSRYILLVLVTTTAGLNFEQLLSL